MKTLILFLIAFLSTISTTLYSQQWEQLYPSWEANDIDCLLHWNGDTVFAGGKNWTLLRSVDGGESWKEVFDEERQIDIYKLHKYRGGILIEPDFWLTRFVFEDNPTHTYYYYNPETTEIQEIVLTFSLPQFGVTQYVWTSVTSNSIFSVESPFSAARYAFNSSTDMGRTWWSSELPTLIQINYQSRIKFINDTHGWLIGYKYNNRKPFLFSTTDGGRSWHEFYKGPLEGFNNSIVFKEENGSNILSVGNTGKTIYSTDIGNTWHQTSSIQWDGDGYASHTFFTNGDGFVFGRKGSVFSTTDFGQSWHKENGQDFAGIPSIEVANALVTRDIKIRCLTGGMLQYQKGENAEWAYARKTDFGVFANLHFFDNANGVAEVYEWGGSNKSLAATNDSGKTWDILPHDINEAKTLPIQYVEPDLALRMRSWNAGAYEVHRSSDLGATWETVKKWDASDPGSGFVLTTSGKNNLFVKSKQGTSVSNDAGTTWTFYPDNIDALEDGYETSISTGSSFVMKSSLYGYIFSNGSLYKTENGCQSWENVYTPPDSLGKIQEVDVPTENTVILRTLVSGTMTWHFSGSAFFISTDRGITWSLNLVRHHYNESHYHTDGTGYIRSWNTMYAITNFNVTDSVIFHKSARESNKGIFLHSTGTAWHYINNALFRQLGTNLPNPSDPPEVPASLGLYALYPNPVFSGQTLTIQYASIPDVVTSITITDLLGRQFGEIYNRETDATLRTTTWQPPLFMPTGLYIVTMKAGSNVSIKKIAVVR